MAHDTDIASFKVVCKSEARLFYVFGTWTIVTNYSFKDRKCFSHFNVKSQKVNVLGIPKLLDSVTVRFLSSKSILL